MLNETRVIFLIFSLKGDVNYAAYDKAKWSGNLSKKQLLQEPIIISLGIQMQILQNYSGWYFIKNFRKFLNESIQ